VVRHGERGHAQLGRATDQRLDIGRAVEEGVGCVEVKVSELAYE